MEKNRNSGRATWHRGVIVLMLPLAACFEHTYHVGSGAPDAPVVDSRWRHHWIAGLIDPGKELDVRSFCPSGNATIHQEQSFLNGLVGALTSGIYTPTTVEIRCFDGARADLELSEDELRSIAASPRFLEWVEEVSPDLLEDAVAALEP